MDEKALKKITAARTALVLNEPFFGSLSLRLALRENSAIKTWRTDGVHIEYNPEYTLGLSHDETVGIICHEVLHVALGHAWRRDTRDVRQWNEACDYKVNQVCVSAGLRLPGKPYLDSQFDAMSEEQVYTRLQGNKEQNDDEQQDEQQDGDGTGDDDGDEQSDQDAIEHPGEVIDAPAQERQALEQEWQVATMQAAQVAQGQGKLPGALRELVEAMKEAKTDWRAATLRFAQERAASDYSWRLPNTRYLQSGLYLPALRSEEMGEIVVPVDTSGSCYGYVPAFGAHLQTILDTVRPRALHVVYCDDAVQTVDTYEPGDIVKLRRDGGGGTSFVPPFEWIAEQGIEPACVIYLTDLCGDFPPAPSYPVLWACPEKYIKAPFGETVYIGEG